MRACILPTCGRHDHIISLRADILVQQTSLTPPLLIEVPVPSQEGGQSCAFGVRNLPQFVLFSDWIWKIF